MSTPDHIAQPNAPPDLDAMADAELLALHERCSVELGRRGLMSEASLGGSAAAADESRENTFDYSDLRDMDRAELQRLLEGESDPRVIRLVTTAFIFRKRGELRRVLELAGQPG